jgi:hypothetical protein
MTQPYDVLLDDLREMCYNEVDVRGCFDALLPFRDTKDKKYRRSWAKRGLSGYFSGAIGRSTDRIDEVSKDLMRSIAKGDDDDIDQDALYVLDTLMDTAMYSLMGICLVASYRPEVWSKFLVNLRNNLSGKDS